MPKSTRVACLALLLLAAPLAAQTVGGMRPMVVAPAVGAIQVDWKAQYDKEHAKNQELRGQVSSLQAQLDAWTAKGGSLVHAYCESETVSRNSAGASQDCAASGGFRCEPVSGLCRTTAQVTSDCAPYFLMEGGRCVPQPRGE